MPDHNPLNQKYANNVSVGPCEKAVIDFLEKGDDPRKAFDSFWFLNLDQKLSIAFGLYKFSTEHISSYLPYLNVAGKRCLTVAASGDQIISLLMAGAKEIIAFDTAKASEEVSCMKMQALVDLDWEDKRKSFPIIFWKHILNPQAYAKLVDRMDTYNRNYRIYSVMEHAINRFNIGHADDIFLKYCCVGKIPYLENDDNFDLARQNCATALMDGRVSFIQADVRELSFMGLGKFDSIILSNILQSRFESIARPNSIIRSKINMADNDEMDKSNILKGLVDTMIWPVANMLAPGGVMMASYNYACHGLNENDEAETSGLLEKRNSRLKAFGERPGFSIEEHQWDLANQEHSGFDIGTFIRCIE